jgi:hypothetical protein
VHHDSNVRTEEIAPSRPGFLVVEWSGPQQDYTIHPYFILSTAFPSRPLSSCPGSSSQKLSVPHILSEKVIPPSHCTAELSPLFTDKTEQQKEKLQNNDPVSDSELFESSLPFSVSFNSDTICNVQASVSVPVLVSSSNSFIKYTELSCL